MLGFLKVFLRGLVCTVLLPVILLVWVLYSIYCLITFFVMLIKSIFLFFAGDNAAGELKEDIEAKRILLEAEQAKAEQQQMMGMMYQNMAMQQQMMGQMLQQNQQQFPQQATNDFDPFNPDPINENPIPGSETPVTDSFEQPEVSEGGSDDDQSN